LVPAASPGTVRAGNISAAEAMELSTERIAATASAARINTPVNTVMAVTSFQGAESRKS
jgi:hypothetical protein